MASLAGCSLLTRAYVCTTDARAIDVSTPSPAHSQRFCSRGTSFVVSASSSSSSSSSSRISSSSSRVSSVKLPVPSKQPQQQARSLRRSASPARVEAATVYAEDLDYQVSGPFPKPDPFAALSSVADIAKLAAQAAQAAEAAEMLEEEDAEFPSAEDRRRLEEMREKELKPSRMPREQRRSKAKGVAAVGNENVSSTVGAQAKGTRTRRTRTVSSVSRKVSTVSTRPLSTANTPSSEVAAMEALYANHAASMSENREDVQAKNSSEIKRRGSGGATSAVNKKHKMRKRAAKDTVHMYLKEIGGVKLLTAAQEIELARQIQDLLELEKVEERLEGQLERKPTEEEWSAALGMSKGPFLERLTRARRAKQQMITANLRLVVSIAKNYLDRGMSFQDLIQEGSMGLIRGAEKFDHRRGYKFSTYAHWWIRQAVTRSIADQSRTIRLPVHLFEIMSRINKTTKLLATDLGRQPTEAELADALSMTQEKIKAIDRAALLPLSLEAALGPGQARKLEDTIEDKNQISPEDSTAHKLLREDLENVLNTLSPRERDVLRLRYGLVDGRVHTLEEIGRVFSVTRERIRQIEAKALRKLRQPSRNGVLKDYVGKEKTEQEKTGAEKASKVDPMYLWLEANSPQASEGAQRAQEESLELAHSIN